VNFDLKDRVVVATGAANGIGRQLAIDLAAAGALVAVADLDVRRAEQVAEEIRGCGGSAVAVAVDVAESSSVQAMIDRVDAEYGRIDGLVNGAAIFTAVAVERLAYDEIPESAWDATLNVTLKGAWLCSRAVAPVMRRQRRGSIVNIGSGTAFKGTPYLAHYVAAKAGVLGLTRALARELGAYDVTVNCVAPGAVRTRDAAEDPAAQGDADVAGRAIVRPAAPSDVTGAIAFFLSDAASFVTGQTLVVDGGAFMH
jgi:3-oxoacyl-[acyl-carrier protein] reductase